MLTNTRIQIKELSDKVGRKIINVANTSLLELNKEEIINLFKSYGVLLFRGFETDVDTFAKFSNSLSTDFIDYTGGVFNRQMINGEPTILTVTDFNHEVKLHGEMYYTKNPPLMIWFFCANPPLQDGETILCDGEQLFCELSSSMKDLFNSKKLKFSDTLNKEDWQEKYKTNDFHVVQEICNINGMEVKINEDESIIRHFLTSAIHKNRTRENYIFINSLLAAKHINPETVCFDDDSEIRKEIILELNKIAQRITIEISWKKGDILMIDNTKIMHGRRAFDDQQRDIYIRLCSPSFSF